MPEQITTDNAKQPPKIRRLFHLLIGKFFQGVFGPE